MKVYTNLSLVKRRSRLGFWSTLIGVGLMVGAVFLAQDVNNALGAWLVSLAGLGVALFGTYNINRWARKPMAYVMLPELLDKLDSRYLLLNHSSIAPHLLLTPKGIIVLRGKRYEGPITYDANAQQWKGRFSLGRFYSQGLTAEGLGNPSTEAAALRNDVEGWLTENEVTAPVAPVILFTSPLTTFAGDSLPVTVAVPDTLKKTIQEQFADLPLLPHDTYQELQSLLETRATNEGLAAAIANKKPSGNKRVKRKRI